MLEKVSLCQITNHICIEAGKYLLSALFVIIVGEDFSCAESTTNVASILLIVANHMSLLNILHRLSNEFLSLR